MLAPAFLHLAFYWLSSTEFFLELCWGRLKHPSSVCSPWPFRQRVAVPQCAKSRLRDSEAVRQCSACGLLVLHNSIIPSCSPGTIPRFLLFSIYAYLAIDCVTDRASRSFTSFSRYPIRCIYATLLSLSIQPRPAVSHIHPFSPVNSALVNHNRQYATAMVAIEAVVIGSTAWKIAHTCLSAAFIGVPVLINAIYGSKQTSQPCNHNPIQHGDHFHYNNDIVQDTFEDDSQIYHHHHHHHNPGTITVSW